MDFSKIQQEYMSKIDHTLFSKNHIESFDYFLKQGIKQIVDKLDEVILLPQNHPNLIRKEISFKISEIKPGFPNQTPYETRLTHATYSMPLFATISIKVDQEEFIKNLSFGNIPLMVLSKNCILTKEKNKLHKYNEDQIEVGGYFVVNGLEKILRNIIVPRKNYPMCVVRGTFQNRRNSFTNYAVNIRSSNGAYRTQSLFLIYTQDQTVYLSIMIKKIEYLFPIALIIKALVDVNDFAFVKLLELQNQNFNPINLLKELHGKGLKNQQQCLGYIGFLMRNVMSMQDQTNLKDQEVGEIFLQQYILIHLSDNWEKVRLLNYMIQKLYFLQSGQLKPENLDSLSMQEILSSGQLYGMFFREKLEEVLQMVKYKILKDLQRATDTPIVDLIEKAFQLNCKVGSKIETLLSTGNIKSRTGLDLMQSNGFSIIAERLNNMRFWSHLRSIHRGAYFVEMKTTSVRKLLPDCWGFMCPVHTPDGSLCGLLNHLAMGCLIQNETVELTRDEKQNLIQILTENGMLNSSLQNSFVEGTQTILFDGQVLGIIDENESENFVQKIRKILKNPKKTISQKLITLSITHVQQQQTSKQNFQPGIYLSCSEGRPLRDVYNIKNKFIERIDPLEQQYMMIATNLSELNSSHTHIEIDEDLLLSELAAQTPFQVHNQSPRNMYQCQMAKQTMGIPTLALQRRADNKMYIVNYPQKPLIKSQTFDQLGFDHFPSGTNAVIAVLSYTGFDIEDAMIINKQAYERGFMHGRVEKTSILKLGQENLKNANLLCQTQEYKDECKELKDQVIDTTQRADINTLIKNNQKGGLQIDGLPLVESRARKGDSKICFIQQSQKKFKYFKEGENCKVENIFVSKQKDQEDNINVDIKVRISRNPVVGDKFSSRHGQKGVLGILWNQIDMPFSETGITPDIIINPNAFPSRMTIGMLIEILAGKTACLKGDFYKTKAFQRCDFSKIGDELQKFGLNKMGTELLYSGVYGVPLKADIYQGVVYYQRLRHMIKDKAQARSTGPIDCLTRQPIKGRKKGGGIRLGEMERDALIAHGVSYILKERLLNSSDKNTALICSCGSFLNTYQQYDSLTQKTYQVCKKCQSQNRNSEKSQVTIPYVLRYLVNELAAMNIKINFKTKQLNQQIWILKELQKKISIRVMKEKIFKIGNLIDSLKLVIQKDDKRYESQTKDNIFGGYKNYEILKKSAKNSTFIPLFKELTAFKRKMAEYQDHFPGQTQHQPCQQRKDILANDVRWNDVRYQKKDPNPIVDPKYQLYLNLQSSDIFKPQKVNKVQPKKRIQSCKKLYSQTSHGRQSSKNINRFTQNKKNSQNELHYQNVNFNANNLQNFAKAIPEEIKQQNIFEIKQNLKNLDNDQIKDLMQSMNVNYVEEKDNNGNKKVLIQTKVDLSSQLQRDLCKEGIILKKKAHQSSIQNNFDFRKNQQQVKKTKQNKRPSSNFVQKRVINYTLNFKQVNNFNKYIANLSIQCTYCDFNTQINCTLQLKWKSNHFQLMIIPKNLYKRVVQEHKKQQHL